MNMYFVWFQNLMRNDGWKKLEPQKAPRRIQVKYLGKLLRQPLTRLLNFVLCRQMYV